MKPFWRSFWASSLATLIISLIASLIFILIIIIITNNLFEKKPFTVENNSILHIKFNQPITEKSYSEIDPISPPYFSKTLGIREFKIGLDAAVKDEKIEGLLLNVNNLTAGLASIEEIRKSINDFKKKSGKFVIAYSEFYDQKGYYLSTVADRIYLMPTGLLDFRGIGVELMFFKGAIDKLGIEIQIIKGKNNKYKSYVEPFINKK